MEKPVKVTNVENMDRETFAKHFTLRHKAHLGGSSRLSGNLTDEMFELHKVFHKKIHQLTLGLDHEHSQADKVE